MLADVGGEDVAVSAGAVGAAVAIVAVGGAVEGVVAAVVVAA